MGNRFRLKVVIKVIAWIVIIWLVGSFSWFNGGSISDKDHREVSDHHNGSLRNISANATMQSITIRHGTSESTSTKLFVFIGLVAALFAAMGLGAVYCARNKVPQCCERFWRWLWRKGSFVVNEVPSAQEQTELRLLALEQAMTETKQAMTDMKQAMTDMKQAMTEIQGLLEEGKETAF